MTLDDDLLIEIVREVSDETGYNMFMNQAASCHWCSQPIRLVGTTQVVDAATGELHSSFSSYDLPGGEYFKACGTRLATRCPACAFLYQGDARRIVLEGLFREDGLYERHPAVFVTLTAPSFGSVHSFRPNGSPCHARGPGRCAHGQPISCLIRHEESDPRVGEAICVDCYDFEGAVLFNANLSELWRRTTIYLRRYLARIVNISPSSFDAAYSLSYVKVVEIQARGVAHLHAVVRIDSIDDDETTNVTSSQLALALRMAAGKVSVPLPGDHGETRWGEQIDLRALSQNAEDRQKVANYLAKYSTKGSATSGALDRRVRSEKDIENRSLPRQLRAMAAAAWRLGGDIRFTMLRLRHWTHTLGVRSHFLTKSSKFSTTFRAVRAIRAKWRATQADAPVSPLNSEVSKTAMWSFRGRGWMTRSQTFLALNEARQRIDNRRLGAEERREDAA